jgi:transaldolase
MQQFSKLKVKIYADGADLDTMIKMSQEPYIKGLTTNPTLMKKNGVLDYKKFAKEVLSKIHDKPISFEVFSDDLDEMKIQALEIAGWGENVNVKIPITNSIGKPTSELIQYLAQNNVRLNVTALMTIPQVKEVINVLNPKVPSYISVFAGRIADTGIDPIPMMEQTLKIMSVNKNAELIWASPREVLNVVQADKIGCHIITATSEILTRLNLIGKNLDEYSLETVKMFRNDALESGYSL